ncbi:MAG: glycoside hydrolase family 15 protein [Prochlorococcaceae cyanobacterium]
MTLSSADIASGTSARALPAACASAEPPTAPQQLSDTEARRILGQLDDQIEAVVLRRQHPITGLLPASTAHTVHGNYGDAWVRDCVYSIQCVWGLALAHRRLGQDPTRVFELEQRVLQLMRGLLNAMLRQAPKLERFKISLAPLDAIHAKFDTATGNPVVADDGWGHLQLDATGLFLLQIAQLTRAGLVVVQTSHERDFLQNLVYYVARAYRVADYGIWERGDKGNHGLPERNASSIGLVKAALESLDGLDLYGPHGDGRSKLHIPHDAIVRLRRALQGLLPRESASKEVDSACLSVIGYPAWAVEDPRLIQRTRTKIREVLGGAYGYKRFPRDGHQTVVEDHTRLHYEREELAAFTAIECEWPLFFAYELVTACCEERWQEAWQWRQRLEAVSVVVEGVPLLPELYLVPEAAIEVERARPGSQPRVANPNVPLLWTQSLTWLGDLMLNGLLLPADLDPCGRRHGLALGAEKVLVGLVPANESIAASLSEAGLPVTEPAGAAGTGPLRVASSKELAERMANVGRNSRLGLSGHPPVRMEAMATGRLYKHGDQTLAFLPAVLEEGTFYLADDPEQLADTVGSELRHLQRHWRGGGVPLLLIPVAEGPFQRNPEAFLRLGESLRSGLLESVPVQLASLEAVLDQLGCVALSPEARPESAPVEDVDPLLRASTSRQPLTARQELELELEAVAVADLAQRLWQSTSLPEQAELLEQLVRRLGPNAILQGPSSRGPVKLLALVERIYHRALGEADWSVVRRCAGVMGLVHPQLEDALTDLLVRQKQVVVGRNYTHDSLISQPQGSLAIAAMIERFSGEDGREWMLQQELLLALDSLARLEPSLLSGSLTLQLGQLLLLLTGELASERDLAADDAFEALCGLPPHAIRRRLRAVLADGDHAKAALQRKEQLHVSGRVRWEVPDPLEDLPSGGNWLQHRQRLGALQRVPGEFYAGIWNLLHHCKGVVIGDKLERRNRLDCDLISEMTSGERNFATLVEHLLSKIEAPEYRQLCTETLLSLIAFIEANPRVEFADYLALDVVIGHAVRVGWQQKHTYQNASSYPLHKAEAWEHFYGASPADCRRWQILALKELTQLS